jgi:peptide/nickel transport system permease protein
LNNKRIRSRSFLGRVLTNQEAAVGLLLISAVVIIGSLAPLLYPQGPYSVHLTEQYEKPSFAHPFGTDELGRDVLGRIVWAIRITLIVGFIAAIISAFVGTVLGGIAGYFGGWIDHVIMRLVDLMLCIPMFFLVLLIILIFGGGIYTVMLVIGMTIWPNGARLIRTQFLSIRELDFVKAARVAGSSDFKIIFKEILPNAIFPVIVDSSLRIGTAILTEAGLSFLGAGDPSSLSLGWMLNEAIPTFRSAWWTGVYPGLILAIILVSFNLIGDGLNDALNVRLTQT